MQSIVHWPFRSTLGPTHRSDQVVVEGIFTDYEEEEDEEEEEEEEEYEDDFDQEHDFDDEENGGQVTKGPRDRQGRFSRLRHRNRSKTPPRRKSKRSSVAAATVQMRHPASGTRFLWKTAGIKDTSGEELHEGDSYRLVATVKEEASAASPVTGAGAVGVTRCRLTPVTAR